MYDKDEFFLKKFTSLVLNDNYKSLVLAARGSSIHFQENSYIEPTINLQHGVSGNGGYLSGKINSMNLYSWLSTASVSQVKNLLRKNPKQSEWIKHRFKRLNWESCKCVIALLDLTEEDSDLIDDGYLTFAKLKIGGTELISEFLLSQFITEWEDEFESENFEPNGEEFLLKTYGDTSSLSKLLNEPEDSEKIVVGQCAPMFKLDKHSNLEHLTKYKLVQYEDEFEIWDREEGSYVYFNVDIEKKEKLDKEFYVPKRVLEILDDSQKEQLRKNASLVIEDNLAYVYKSVLKQKIPTFDSGNLNPQRDTWGADMYSILGGDGHEDVYLGDGMSIDSNGKLVDD